MKKRILALVLAVCAVIVVGASSALAANVTFNGDVGYKANRQVRVLSSEYNNKIYKTRDWVCSMGEFTGGYQNTGVCMGLIYNNSSYGKGAWAPQSLILTNQMWFKGTGYKTAGFLLSGYTGYMRITARQDDANSSTHSNYVAGYFNADASA